MGTSTNSGTFSGSVGYGGDFHGNNNWSWGANGQFVGDYSEFGMPKDDYEAVEGMTMHRIMAHDSKDRFGHYWIESDGRGGFGYYPEDGASKIEAITRAKWGEIVFGNDKYSEFFLKQEYKQVTKRYKVYAPKGSNLNDQLNIIPASHFGKKYGVPIGKHCRTYQRDIIKRNQLYLERY